MFYCERCLETFFSPAVIAMATRLGAVFVQLFNFCPIYGCKQKNTQFTRFLLNPFSPRVNYGDM